MHFDVCDALSNMEW